MNYNRYAMLKNYNGQRVLVTGGAGFVGSNVVRELLSLGADVVVLDDLFTGSKSNLKGLDGFDFIEGDVRDKELVNKITGNFDFVFHLAARNIIVSTTRPHEDLEVNIGGTLNLLLAARNSSTKLKKFLYASSTSIYGNSQRLPIKEDDSVDLLSPYAVSKLGGENYTTTFHRIYDIPTTVVRYSNVYGEFQSPENTYSGVVSKFIAAISEDKPLYVHDDGEQTRDFTYVEDAVDATLLAGIYEKSNGGIYNVGTGVETSVNRLASLIGSVYGKVPTIHHVDKRDIDNVKRRVLDIEKARKGLGWQPKFGLEEGLKRTVDWYEKERKEAR